METATNQLFFRFQFLYVSYVWCPHRTKLHDMGKSSESFWHQSFFSVKLCEILHANSVDLVSSQTSLYRQVTDSIYSITLGSIYILYTLTQIFMPVFLAWLRNGNLKLWDIHLHREEIQEQLLNQIWEVVVLVGPHRHNMLVMLPLAEEGH